MVVSYLDGPNTLFTYKLMSTLIRQFNWIWEHEKAKREFMMTNLQDDALLSAYYDVYNIKVIDMRLASFYSCNMNTANTSYALHNSIHHNPHATILHFKDILLTTTVN